MGKERQILISIIMVFPTAMATFHKTFDCMAYKDANCRPYWLRLKIYRSKGRFIGPWQIVERAIVNIDNLLEINRFISRNFTINACISMLFLKLVCHEGMVQSSMDHQHEPY